MKTQATIRAALTLLLACAAAAADDAAEVKNLEAAEWTVPEIGIEMKLIPAGSFTMGSPGDEIGRRADEVQHTVTISKPFYMGAHELRQREFYELIMPADYDYPSWRYQRGPLHDGAAWTFRRKGGGGNVDGADAATGIPRTDLNPMECVTWERAVAFCEKLTGIEKKAGRLPEGYVYRLPTEAEWEYACRAGAKGAYSFDGDYSQEPTLLKYMFIHGGNDYTLFTSATPGGRQPNAWGLYDMHGNVFEWCLDWYGPYDLNATKDPTGPPVGKERVARGGGVGAVDKDLDKAVHPFFRCASRYSFPPQTGYQINLGFRVVLGPEVRVGE